MFYPVMTAVTAHSPCETITSKVNVGVLSTRQSAAGSYLRYYGLVPETGRDYLFTIEPAFIDPSDEPVGHIFCTTVYSAGRSYRINITIRYRRYDLPVFHCISQ